MEQYDSKNKIGFCLGVFFEIGSRQGFGPDLYPIITKITKGDTI